MKLDTSIRQDRLGGDERAVSEIIGAIFVFALLIMVLSLMQLWAVPAANQQTEFDHNQRALADMQSFASEVDRAAGLGKTGSSTIEVGPQYSTRMFLLNPPAPAGTLETADGTITIENIQAINSETDDYLDGSSQNFATRSLTFRPNYNEYANAPTTRYEGWTLYNQFEETNIVQSQRSPISGDRISLIALDGTQSTSAGGSLVVPTEPISAPSRAVAVSGENGEDIDLTLTTGLSQADWDDILADEMGANGNVEAVVVADGEVTITLDGSETYTLTMAKVGIGSRTTEEGAHYLTASSPRPVLDNTGGTVTVHVRDRFNNPVAGVEVTFGSPGVTFDESTVVSEEDGTATAHFTNPSAIDSTDIVATADVNPEPAANVDERGTVELTNVPVRFEGVINTHQSEINPSDEETIKFVSADARNVERGTGTNARWVIDLEFDNHGENVRLERSRFNAYIRNTFSASERIVIPESADLYAGSFEAEPSESHFIRGPYETWTGASEVTLAEGPNTFILEFRDDGTNFNPNNGDFFMVSIETENEVSRYFIQVRKPTSVN